MANNSSNSKTKTQVPSTVPKSKIHHYFRTLLSSFLGFVGLNLIILSILAVWLNTTLNNSKNFVNTLGPIIGRQEVQNFLANNVSQSLTKAEDFNVREAAVLLLGEEQCRGKSDEQLRYIVNQTISSSFVQAINNTQTQTAWRQTLNQSHLSVMNFMNSRTDKLILDIGPIFNQLIEQLGQTKLAPVVNKMELKADNSAVRVDLLEVGLPKGIDQPQKQALKSQLINQNRLQYRKYYKLFNTATILIVFVAILSLGLSVLIAVHHGKTLRRILVSTGISTGFLATTLFSQSYIINSAIPDKAQAAMISAIADTLTQQLRISLLAISVSCFTVAILSKCAHYIHKVPTPTPRKKA